MEYIIGIDIGGTKTAISLAGTGSDIPQIVDGIRFETPKSGYASTLQSIIDNCYKLLDNNGILTENLRAVGICCGGPLDAENGIILSPPNLPGWDHIPICRHLEEEFSVPAFLENDANACALAEWKFGAGRGCSNLVFLTFGTGFGAGFILNGQLYRGANGMAGEIGHCESFWHGDGNLYCPVGHGRSGSLEGFCSGSGIAELGRTIALQYIQQGRQVSFCPDPGNLQNITAQTIASAAYAGDEAARRVYRISGEKLGSALALLTDILNPELIIIGSIYTRSTDLLREAALRTMQEQSLPLSCSACRVLPSGLGEQLADIAPVCVAINSL